MHILIYDGSFEGWLTAVFEVFEYKLGETEIVTENETTSLFGRVKLIYTEEAKARRVWKGLAAYLTKEGLGQIWKTFLSERPRRETYLLHFVKLVFERKEPVNKDFTQPSVVYLTQTARQVHREKHRMEAFIRFKKAVDGLFVATVEPDFNVLPLIRSHFEKRYADQRWLIYDLSRKYGLYYDLEKTTMVSLSPTDEGGSISSFELDPDEEAWQQLWQKYFSSANIVARKNLKLHIKHMPLRYWKHLTEKQGFPQ